jgi:adenine-specific DNA-methyltransferase
MSREILKDIIKNFSTEKFIYFFRNKNTSFRPMQEELSNYNDENFTSGEKISEIDLQDNNLIVCAFQVLKELTERSGKKKQYELGKKILKDTNKDAGIFIFYDKNGNFRFSLIYTEYLGTTRKFSYFKRFTYFVSPLLTNKTFLKQIGEGDFSSFEKIKEAFSIEPVTKQFYEEIQNWYFWTMDKVKFPEDYKYSDDPDRDKEIRNATNLIRLITRLIFIWFIKEKGLIPEVLFDRKKLKGIVKNFNKPDASNYYNAILQNLFFATLNSKMEERGWAKDEGFPKNKTTYGIKNLYRYEDKFLISEKEVLSLFKEIPFLNGGLFDCLDKEDESGKVIYIDGFSRNSNKQAIIPDYLFFQQDEIRVDLSKYGLGSNKPVRGLIEILKSYNFTIDENTPIDQEVALDPELLGKVFENLLASYNSETASTARKATGSYYTPREIVDYMVDESLKEYFKTQLPEIDEEKIELLVSYAEELPEFSEDEKKKIIYAIDRIKILDPACGSGAFPMGILHKLVHILQKLDPKNIYWYELQYQKALKASEEVFKEKDKSEREAMLKEINEAFDESINYPDYARKLYLIENCIYGVDIQPIAVQISKLRFFISLVLDQKVDRTKENYGIRPLPNLETKFVATNTLIGLEKPEHIFYTDEIKKLEEEIKKVRHKYFTAKTRTEKLRLQQKDKKLREELSGKLKSIGFSSESSQKIVSFDLFDQNASADWFDPEWMFGVVEGFDIVIGNPPYVRQEKIKHLKPSLQQQNYQTFTSTADLYVYFYEKGHQLLKDAGILSFISSNKWMRAKYGNKLRNFLRDNTAVLKIIDFSGYRVFEQTVDTNILLFSKGKPENWHTVNFVEIKSDVKNVIEYINQNWQTIPQEKLSDNAWTLADEKVLAIKEKIERIGKPLKDWDVKIYRGVLTGYNEAFIIDTETRDRILANCKDEGERKRTEELIKPVLRGRDIGKYYYKWVGLWVILATKHSISPCVLDYLKNYNEALKNRAGSQEWYELQAPPSKEKINLLLMDKVGYSDIGFRFAYIQKEIVGLNTTYFIIPYGHINDRKKILLYLLGLLNSKLIKFYYLNTAQVLSEKATRGFSIYVEQLPIPPLTPQNQPIADQIITLVDQILSAKKQNPEKDTSKLEKEIDQLVYKFYDLTKEEIKLIERGK